MIALAKSNTKQEQVEKIKPALLVPVSLCLVHELHPRESVFETEIHTLAKDIAQHGVKTPLLAIESKGEYLIISGFKRLMAAESLDKPPLLPILLTLDQVNPMETLIEMLTPHESSTELRPIDQAQAYKTLEELLVKNGTKSSETTERISQVLDIDTTTVEQSLRLLELSDSIKEHVNEGRIPFETAYYIACNKDLQIRENLASMYLTKLITTQMIKERATLPKPQTTPIVSMPKIHIVKDSEVHKPVLPPSSFKVKLPKTFKQCLVTVKSTEIIANRGQDMGTAVVLPFEDGSEIYIDSNKRCDNQDIREAAIAVLKTLKQTEYDQLQMDNTRYLELDYNGIEINICAAKKNKLNRVAATDRLVSLIRYCKKPGFF